MGLRTTINLGNSRMLGDMAQNSATRKEGEKTQAACVGSADHLPPVLQRKREKERELVLSAQVLSSA
jgi:hypothetical protein